ncbi:MAG: RNA 3'-phosphate cyclase [Alphaproteobacteria bacterium]|nr:RNA 3'-phosphate cyclase [Alphaproteobacteria bacterium]
MTGPLHIDGAHGEGGGQILRTALTCSALFRRPVRIENIRAGRKNPGLAAQHITSIRAAGAICAARIEGDVLGSETLTFAPQAAVQPGAYHFDVAEAREGGSAGATSLVLQTVLLPLALADGVSQVTIQGGTHMRWSPPFDYLRNVWLPSLHGIGIDAELALDAWGWFPIGQGRIRATIHGHKDGWPKPMALEQRGALIEVAGRAVAANLPAHIAQRMTDRAGALLAGLGVPVAIEPLRVRAACAGAGIFLTARYETVACGFSALGARGKPAEQVAEEAVAALMAHRNGGAALDQHLGDQILAPLAVANGPSRYSVERISGHLETNAWLIERFGLARVGLERSADGTGLVTVMPAGGKASNPP